MAMRKKRAITKSKRRKQTLPWRWRARVVMHSPEFRLLAHRDAPAITQSRYEAADQAWVDAMSCWNSDEATVDAKAGPDTLASIRDLIGSVDGLPADLGAHKKHYLKAMGYGRKRPR
ncbi:MAG: hypothetical protein HY244_13225 [Rhizobiales bacterium]|nr:hypothetical protein [Hyphomicrobiales bacterium]